MKLLLTLFLFTSMIFAQQTSTRSVNLTWNDDVNPAGTVTYEAMRSSKSCADSTDTDFQKINTTTIENREFLHTPVSFGRYCYYVIAVANVDDSLRSGPSNKADAVVTPAAPNQLQIQVGITVNVNINQ